MSARSDWSQIQVSFGAEDLGDCRALKPAHSRTAVLVVSSTVVLSSAQAAELLETLARHGFHLDEPEADPAGSKP